MRWNKIHALQVILAVAGLSILAFLLRSLHLLNNDLYYIISSDSYFFHWLTQRIMSGEGVPLAINTTYHSGLAYPLAYIAKAISSVFNTPSSESLDIASKLLPLFLGVVSLVVIYLVASKIYNRRVGLLSALAWAIICPACLVGAAGYLDRDGLSMLLLMTAAFLFYLSSSWHLRIGKRDVGWLAAGLAVLIIEIMLYLEWNFVGPMLLLAILIAFFLVRFLLGYVERLETEPNLRGRLSAAIKGVNWRTFILIIGVNILWVVLQRDFAHSFSLVMQIIQARGSGEIVGEIAISEMRGIGLQDVIFAYHLFLIPMVIALYLVWRRRDEGSIFFSCWFLCLLALSLLAKRILLYSVPAACSLSGVGLAFLWDWQSRDQFRLLKKVVIIALLFLIILFSSVATYSLKSGSPDEDWQNALTYLRDNTPQDALIMSQWSYGYWILDLGQRRPLVDNGYYGYDLEKLHAIGIAYTTAEPSEAAHAMEKYGASYLIFSTSDRDIAPSILKWAGLGKEYTTFPEDSLFIRSIDAEFEFGGGLEVVYLNSEVVILGLTQPLP